MPLSQRREFPACSAVYLVVGENQKVLYIGRTVNLRQRWKTHHLYSVFRAINNVRLAWLEVSDLFLIPLIEEALIRHFKPLHNTARIEQEVQPP
jgi:excinuclease UvrABC nuclease subunit